MSAQLATRNMATPDPLQELLAAAKEAVESEGGLRYEDNEDDVGSRACCYVLSYRPHREDCWVPRLQAALNRMKED